MALPPGIRLASDLADARVLVVEGDPASRERLARLLAMLGIGQVTSVGSAEDAFPLLGLAAPTPETMPIDLVLMEIKLPELDGITACSRITSAPAHALTLVMMVTEISLAETLKRAFDAGAVDFIAKPLNPVELEARVRSALGVRRALQARYGREAELERREEELLKAAHVLEEANKRLALLSTRDTLTGVANRRGLMDFYNQEWRRAARAKAGLSLLMMDVDGFKSYNDTYGHQAGDECLWAVAAGLKACLNRGADLVGRYGGEEFLAVLPGTPLQGALKVGEQMRKSVQDQEIGHSASPVASVVTISVGVACGLPGVDLSPEALLETADRALYEAKHQGRNRVFAAPEDDTAKLASAE